VADRLGQQFGNYRLVSLLGQGGYAEVYLGRHVRFNQQAAIKVLHAHLSGQEAEHFQQEAETIATLAHPSIVRVFDFDVQEGVPFLVMEYAPHGSLRRRYPKGSLVPLPQIISAVKQVADALQYAHEQKFIHRDVKPENMLVGRREEVVLSDFGIATIAHSSSSLSASAQGTSGTLAYMAPEQIEGHPRAASDQYALAVVVYEWLCGERPFEGSASEVMAQHLSMPPLPLRERMPAIPVEIEQMVLRALAKDPKQRFARMQDFALALEEAFRTEVSSGHTLLVLSAASPAIDRHASKHTLPAQLTPLIGREQEVVAVGHLLHREDVRLVTLTGAGGIGKTRLGLQVAVELSDLFPDGVYFVNLAPISDPEFVVPTIAQTLGIREAAGQSLLERLQEELHQKQLLLVLDNFEQVVNAASQLVDLLAACPKLKLLVTSREVLHVRAEREFAVPPLALPDPTHLPELAELSRYAAIALFTQQAQAVKSDFQVTAANAQAIAEICVRLDGLPLAIELAAARVKLFPPQTLLARLDQRLHILTSGARDAPVRQQSLRNTLAWSYELLHAEEQRLFRRLSAFVGGCTLQSIEALCAALDKSNGVGQVLGGVASLIDKSLLQQTEQEGEEPRLVMLETIREYGLEVLTVSREMEITRQAHALYYLRLAEEAEPELAGPQQAVWLERLEQEYDNLRAALRWSLERGEVGVSIEMALRLGEALRRFWEVRGHWSEGQSFLERALAGSKGVTVPVQVKALKAAAHLASALGDTDRAEALSEECLVRCRELGDTAGIALSLRLLGVIAWRRSNFVVASSLTEESLALFREVGDKEGIAWSLNNLGSGLSCQGEYARAILLLEESLALFRELGNIEGIAIALFVLADVFFISQGDLARVHTLLEEGLALCREVGHKDGTAQALGLLGEVFLQQGDTVKARLLLEEDVALSREIGYRHAIAESLSLLGRVEALEGDYAAARAFYEESLAIGRDVGDKLSIAFYLEGLADVVAAQGEPAWAAQLWGAAESLREALGTPIPPVYRAAYERSVAATCTQLGEKAFAATWAEGRKMTPEQAFAAQGRAMISTAVPARAASAPPMKSPNSSTGLTAREVEVLRLVAMGLTSEHVAEQLVISPRTVNTHLTAIYGKIGVSSRSAATRYAIEHHLI
jgi:predicted ATPase/DNA-binding CsgD family transcriptional regulator